MIMTRPKICWKFVTGILVGCIITVLVALLWLSSGVSLKRHGEVVVTDFPMGISTVTLENDLTLPFQ